MGKLSEPAFTDNSTCVTQMTQYKGWTHIHTHTHTHTHTPLMLLYFPQIRHWKAIHQNIPCVLGKSNNTMLETCENIRRKIWYFIVYQNSEKTLAIWASITPPHHVVMQARMYLLMPFGWWFSDSWSTTCPSYHHSNPALTLSSHCPQTNTPGSWQNKTTT